jgi:GNAT superfamily N-acetyltransferase
VSIIVRRVVEQDLTGILALYRELRPHDPDLLPAPARQALVKLIQDQNIALIVSEYDGVLTSTCMLAIIPNLACGTRPFGVVEHVVTLREFRRRGHGRKVLEHALNLAWTEGCYKVMLLSGEQRTAAHRFYESVGFVSGLEKGFVARSPDAARQIFAAPREPRGA